MVALTLDTSDVINLTDRISSLYLNITSETVGISDRISSLYFRGLESVDLTDAFIAGLTMPRNFASGNTVGITDAVSSDTILKTYSNTVGVTDRKTFNNEDFADRTSISGATGTAKVILTRTTNEVNEPDALQEAYSDIDRWFYGTSWLEWTAPGVLPDEVVEFDTFDSVDPDSNSLLAVYTGSTFGTMVAVTANDDAGEASHSRVAFRPVAGTVYQIQVGTDLGSSLGQITEQVSWRFIPKVVTNDRRVDASPLTGRTGFEDVDASGATLDWGVDDLDGNDDDAQSSLWWTWSAPADAYDDEIFTFKITVNPDQIPTVYYNFLYVYDDTDTVIATAFSLPGEFVSIDLPVTPGMDYEIQLVTLNSILQMVIEWTQPLDAVGVMFIDGPTVLDATPLVIVPITGGVTHPAIRRISETYALPTLLDGRPQNWRPTSVVDEEWGYIHIIVGGKDVTTVRGVPSSLESLMFQEPFGEGPAQVSIPGASELDYGTVSFPWLDVEKNVSIRKYSPLGAYVGTLWNGTVMSMSYEGDAWMLDVDGAFVGSASLTAHQPKLTEYERDIGMSIVFACRRGGAKRFGTFSEQNIGIKTRVRGSRSQTLLDYVTEMLALAQTTSGGQWTVKRIPGLNRRYTLGIKDTTGVDVTVHARARGITTNLRRDLSQVTRIIWGEGVNANGGRWRGTKLPNVGKETIPPYHGPLSLGSVGTDVAIWQYEMSSDGYEVGTPRAIGSSVFRQPEVDACEELQERAGLPVTGVVNRATWNATWSNGGLDMGLGGAYHAPIAQDPRTVKWLHSSNGSILAPSPTWDQNIMGIGRFISYGEGISKAQAARSARAQLANEKDPGWHGEITLDGVDPIEMSRLEIKEGMNLRLKYWGGTTNGIDLHISGITWRKGATGYAVSLMVDTKARDLLTLAEIMARNRAAKQDPARAAINQMRKSAITKDTSVWDYEGGYGVLPKRDCVGGRWNIFVVAAGQYGTLEGLRLNTSPNTTFAVALFGKKITRSTLNSILPSPLVARTDGYRKWDYPSIQNALEDHLFIEAFGGPGQAGGYSPGYQTNPETGKATGHGITGNLDIWSSTNYGLYSAPRMYVAVWTTRNTTISGRIRLLVDE